MRPSRLFLAVIAIGFAVVSAPAWAEEILHFTNGTTMPIRGHEIKGQMIHIDLGGDSSMAFPLSMVEKVEEAGADVVLDGSPAGNRRVTGVVPSRHSDSSNKLPRDDGVGDPNVETDDNGVAVYRPYAGGASNKARLGVAGNQQVLQGRGRYAGTQRKGSRHVIGGAPQPGGKKEVNPVGLAQKSGDAPPPKKTSDGESDSSGSDSGSESDE